LIRGNPALAGRSVSGSLEGDVETPQYAGSDTVLGGRVTTSQYFRVASERMRSDRF
jgi:hypothetical protein